MPKIRVAASMNVCECDEGHAHIEFLNDKGEVFAECILDMEQALDVGCDLMEIADDEFMDGVPEGATVQ